MISIRDLTVRFGDRTVASLPHLDVEKGEVVGVVGESGSGKSMTALAVLGLAQLQGAAVAGSIKLDGVELVGMSQRKLREIRGRRIAMVMQQPKASLNPTLTMEQLFRRTLRLHDVPRAEVKRRSVEAVESVLLDPALLSRYPHQLSGGQAQRFAIALALALRADVLISDEPTSALDVTVQAEIIGLLRRLARQADAAQLFISHDLAVVSQLADRVVVMQRGAVVEAGAAQQILSMPTHPYTSELLAAVPHITPIAS